MFYCIKNQKWFGPWIIVSDINASYLTLTFKISDSYTWLYYVCATLIVSGYLIQWKSLFPLGKRHSLLYLFIKL